jgi:hypothetical protein
MSVLCAWTLVKVAMRGSRGSRLVSMASAICLDDDPLIRTTPIPPLPEGVATATMESSVENITRAGEGYFRVEMITVFMKASPMLSDVASGSSAMAR